MTAAKKRLARRRRRASKTAVRQAIGLVAELGMVVSIVMAIFFQEQSESGELAGTLSIEGLLPAWCQLASARSPQGRTRLRERSKRGSTAQHRRRDNSAG